MNKRKSHSTYRADNAVEGFFTRRVVVEIEHTTHNKTHFTYLVEHFQVAFEFFENYKNFLFFQAIGVI